MGKPLLTDEVLERAKRRKKQSRQSEFGYYAPEEVPVDFEDNGEDWYIAEDEEWTDEWEDEYTGYHEGQTVRIPVEHSIVKSRRIETVKREAFRAKLNKILFWIVLLLILFLIAVFYL